MTKTEELEKRIEQIIRDNDPSDIDLDQAIISSRQILKACKEAGLMFTEERNGTMEDGWWKHTVIIEALEVK